VSGSSTHAIPVLWHTSHHELSVSAPAEPKRAYEAIQKAVIEWDRTMQWFSENYYRNETHHSEFYFYMTTGEADVKVNYGTPSNNYLGLAENVNDRFIITIDNTLVQNETTVSTETLYRVALHELGHVMGIGDMYRSQDIMNGLAYFYGNIAKPSYLSTLDLYAIHTLASNDPAHSFSFIYLPTDLPYVQLNVDQNWDIRIP